MKRAIHLSAFLVLTPQFAGDGQHMIGKMNICFSVYLPQISACCQQASNNCSKLSVVMKMVTIAESGDNQGALVPCELIELSPSVRRTPRGYEGTFPQINRNVK